MLRVGIYDIFFRPQDPSITWRQTCPSFWRWVDNCDDPAQVDVVMATCGSSQKIVGSKHPRKVLYLQETRFVHQHPPLDSLKQFELVLTNDRELAESLPNGIWMSLFGIRMRPEHYLYVPKKTRSVSLMGSSIDGPSPGHILRWKVHRSIEGKDSFGFDGNTYNKHVSLASYRHQIAVESANYDAWITEKMWDCLALKTMPIYWGGIHQRDFEKLGFDPSGVIWWDGDIIALQEIVNSVNEDDSMYQLAKHAIEFNRKRVLEIPSGEYMLAEILCARFPEIAPSVDILKVNENKAQKQ